MSDQKIQIPYSHSELRQFFKTPDSMIDDDLQDDSDVLRYLASSVFSCRDLPARSLGVVLKTDSE